LRKQSVRCIFDIETTNCKHMRTPGFENELVDLRGQLIDRAVSLSENVEDAEDLTQDTMLKAISYKGNLASDTCLRAWLFTIMKHQFINQRRRSVQYRKVLTEAVSNKMPIVSNTCTYEPSPDSQLLYKEVVQCINRLDSKFREPFFDFISGYKYSEISERYQLPMGTVKSRIYYARKMVLRSLQIE